MGTLRIKRLSTAVLAAAALTAGAATPAAVAAQNQTNAITGTGFGSGTTATAAQAAAADSLIGNFYGCNPPRGNLVYDTKGSNGIWHAEVRATCDGYR